MSEYERSLEIRKAYQHLADGVQDIEGYGQWLQTARTELEQSMMPEDFAGLLEVMERNVSWRQVRDGVLEYLDCLLERLEQERLERVYAVSDDKEIDQNLVNFTESWEQHRSKLLVFLGAGASIGARKPNGRPLPNATELRDLIHRELLLRDLPTEMTLEQVAALAREKVGRTGLCDFVENLFENAKPLWNHATLPFLSPRAVFTTNYDDLIESGWALHHGNNSIDPCEGIFSTDRRNWRDKVPVFKPHGSIGLGNKSIGEGGLVLTQFDYFEMISNNTDLVNSFLRDFESNCVLFIGYSLSDMDIGSQLWSKRNENRDVNWYAVFPCDNLTREMYDRRFGVRVINRKFHEFMKELDEKVDFVPEDWKFQKIQNLRDNGLIG